MTKAVINSFTDAMNKDIDKALMSNKAYLDAQNFRMVTTKGKSTGALETIKGNKLINVNTIVAGQFIIGSCEVRDTLVLFTTNNTSTTPNGGRSMIYSMKVNLETEVGTTPVVLYDDQNNNNSGYLNFSVAHPIKTIGKYETPNIQKVYWTDGYNNLRYVDIAKKLTITGLPYTTDDYMSVLKFEFLPEFASSKPVLVDIVSGSLRSGMVQYAYQLYRLNGAETAISPVSDLIHIVSDNDFATTTLNYKGDSESKETGKGCKLLINNSNGGYNRIRLIRVHYPTLNSIPTISICNESEISTAAGSVYITDTGNVLGDLTIDEFNIASTELFKCQDIASKDNRLFAANITKSEFTIGNTWDARAVRFRSLDNTAYVFDTPYSATGQVVINNTLSNWISSYDLDHNGINGFNDPDNDDNANYQFKYQANGSTVGAEGLNVKIDFETEAVLLDNSNSYTTFSTTSTASSYTNFASPWRDGSLSWQRDEVYRLFVVWQNAIGQTSEPQWIIDLRMPSLHDADFTNSSSANVQPSILGDLVTLSNEVYISVLRPRIYFKSKPTGAVSCQIYRVKRDRSDRSVITQGLVVPTKANGGRLYPDQADVVIPSSDSINLIKLVSPEINITRNVSKRNNDYIEFATYFATGLLTNDSVGPLGAYHRRIDKLVENTRVPYTGNVKSNITEILSVSPATEDSATSGVTIDSKSYCNFNQDGSHTYSKGCSGMLISYSNNNWFGEGNPFVIVNYRSNIANSQYGGSTYEDRSINVSIPCSDVITNINTWYSIKGGDTFINYFDVSTLLVDLSRTQLSSSVSETVFVPLESSINCDLRHDTSNAHASYAISVAVMRQEYLGTHQVVFDTNPGTLTMTYEQDKDLYLYNTVYSQETMVQNAIAFGIDTVLETEFDTMIKVSAIKTNGEMSDSWSKFGINDFLEVDSTYGPINALHLFNNSLYYWQDRAVGIASVNERSLINDKSSAQLVLGTGGVLDRYDYISQRVGCKDKFTVVSSIVGVYWFDRLSKSLYKHGNNLSNLTKTKYIQSYMTTTLDNEYVAIAHSDTSNDEILFTFFKENETNGFTISFNEPIDAFVSFYGFVPTIYIPYQHHYLTTTNSYYSDSDVNRNYLFLHDSNLGDRCYFYALADGQATKYVDSTLELLFNSEYEYVKVFDSIFYTSNAFSNQAEIYSNTFKTVQCYNDFQNTGEVDLIHKRNIERREREWTFNVPRNIVNSSVSNNPNIFLDVDKTQLFKERMRDRYLIVYLTYHNDGSYDRFIVSNIGLKYRASIR
jgi:hypothetical protein